MWYNMQRLKDRRLKPCRLLRQLREYSGYSFQVILVPLGVDTTRTVTLMPHKKRSFVDALLSCPKLGEGETLDISRDSDDYGRDINI